MFATRPQTDADIDEVAALHLRAGQAGYAGIVPADYLAGLEHAEFASRRRQFAQYLASEGALPAATLLAVDGEAIAGFAAVGPYREPDGTLDPARGGLYALYVDPGRWGTGAGWALLQAARAELGRNYPDLRLWVLQENHRARRFYERAGLRPDGARDVWTPRDSSVELPELRYWSPL